MKISLASALRPVLFAALRFTFLVMLLVSSSALAAQNAANIAAGKRLYHEHCEQCHRPEARGDGAKRPALRDDTIGVISDADLEKFIRNGDRRKGMPSWSGLPLEQRQQLIAYLRSLK
jgi:quinoprotein glucose dehydrogenase